jgi:hypothetical protein
MLSQFKTLVSTAFLQLVSRQTLSVRFDGELIAEAIQFSARSLALFERVIGQVQEQPHLGPRGKTKFFVRFQHAVDERGCDQLILLQNSPSR